jgi:hypothetical protein
MQDKHLIKSIKSNLTIFTTDTDIILLPYFIASRAHYESFLSGGCLQDWRVVAATEPPVLAKYAVLLKSDQLSGDCHIILFIILKSDQSFI